MLRQLAIFSDRARKASMSNEAYFETRLAYDPRRETLWSVLTDHIQKKFGIQGSILELGCGHGDFINFVKTDKKFAIDFWRSPRLKSDIRFHEGSIVDLKKAFPGEKFDTIFTSNLLEHLTREQISELFAESMNRLESGGLFIHILPNYRFASAEYFDDYTHITPISHIGLCDWLAAAGFKISFVHPRYLPYSMKNSKMPVWRSLVQLWLLSPWKPGKQMIVVGQKI